MGSTNLRAHHFARPGRAESERSQASEACTFPLLRVTYLRSWWGVGGVERNSSSDGKNRSPPRWGAGWGAGWGAASKTRIGRCARPDLQSVFEATKADDSMPPSTAIHLGLEAETTSEAYFLLLEGRPPLLCGRPQVQRQDAREQSAARSEEHTSELQSLMRTSYAVFCLKKKLKHHLSPPV